MMVIQVPKPGQPDSNQRLHEELDKLGCRNPADDFGVFYIAKPEYGSDWSENFAGGTLHLGWDDNSRTFLAKYVFDESGRTTIYTMEDGKETPQGSLSWVNGFRHAKKWICKLMAKERKVSKELLKKFETMEIQE